MHSFIMSLSQTIQKYPLHFLLLFLSLFLLACYRLLRYRVKHAKKVVTLLQRNRISIVVAAAKIVTVAPTTLNLHSIFKDFHHIKELFDRFVQK